MIYLYIYLGVGFYISTVLFIVVARNKLKVPSAYETPVSWKMFRGYLISIFISPIVLVALVMEYHRLKVESLLKK